MHMSALKPSNGLILQIIACFSFCHSYDSPCRTEYTLLGKEYSCRRDEMAEQTRVQVRRVCAVCMHERSSARTLLPKSSGSPFWDYWLPEGNERTRTRRRFDAFWYLLMCSGDMHGVVEI